MLKVTLIVVSGKPEGKVIPLTAPVFRIGRDESCHLRPNSVEVSRQHTEITISDTTVVVNDLGSRNGTLVNGQLITAPHRLKSGELLKVGPLTFAVSIHETSEAAVATGLPSAPVGRPTLESAPQGQIESWLVADNARPTPDRPSGVYDGDTLTIDAYTGAGGVVPGRPAAKPASSGALPAATPGKPMVRPASAAEIATVVNSHKPAAKPAPEAAPAPAAEKRVFDDDSLEFEQLEEGHGDNEEHDTVDAAETEDGETEHANGGEFIDESNPFFIPKKKTAAAVVEDSKKSYSDTSDAANDILRRMIDRRRASKS